MRACADPHADEMRSYAAQVPVVTYAMHNKNADVYQEKMRFSLWETEVGHTPALRSVCLSRPHPSMASCRAMMSLTASGCD